MLTRLVPHPLLTILITVVWVLLNNDVSIAQAMIGLVLGLLIPKATSAYWPGRPRMRAPLVVIEYLLIVLWDIVVSNVQVAYLVLFRRGDRLRTRYITVPLVLTTPEAITVLAGTITMTPGTVTADVSADGRALLVHCLETDDPEATIARIKTRYEQRLKRIFE
ncbi:Na+/H+ antiporter subunit E [Mesorhizobium tianshanense]|uniref:Multicomponent K+:H+ antiporter subunit E n=1 Tax=Mesorhizobium tianshanense TaxID=39844 RepID=A0A562PC49_9HYPH|nr:Na+/H+ antiporter subunit E [Mesorhizobium tianshanense]TWI42007.1 multicomponent K+:H+ antiporter subunit E [Mesorhizobium tianshanense]GLS34667.1 Na+/H+ antiporter subunit E [Mesorhizobium tianshanense]